MTVAPVGMYVGSGTIMRGGVMYLTYYGIFFPGQKSSYVLGIKGKSASSGTCILDVDFLLPLQNTYGIKFGLHLCMAVCTDVPLDVDFPSHPSTWFQTAGTPFTVIHVQAGRTQIWRRSDDGAAYASQMLGTHSKGPYRSRLRYGVLRMYDRLEVCRVE